MWWVLLLSCAGAPPSIPEPQTPYDSMRLLGAARSWSTTSTIERDASPPKLVPPVHATVLGAWGHGGGLETLTLDVVHTGATARTAHWFPGRAGTPGSVEASSYALSVEDGLKLATLLADVGQLRVEPAPSWGAFMSTANGAYQIILEDPTTRLERSFAGYLNHEDAASWVTLLAAAGLALADIRELSGEPINPRHSPWCDMLYVAKPLLQQDDAWFVRERFAQGSRFLGNVTCRPGLEALLRGATRGSASDERLIAELTPILAQPGVHLRDASGIGF